MVKGIVRNVRQRTDGVYSDYPTNWPEIATAVKDAANQRCARCLHPAEGAWKLRKGENGIGAPCDMGCRHEPDGKQRVLTVHHLDVNKANIAWWNLAPLCQACHLSVQARVDWHQYYMLDHSSWMKPYVKGWTIYQLTGTTVVKVKLAPCDVYMGRPMRNASRYRGAELANQWGNPFKISKAMPREESIGRYTDYIRARIDNNPEGYDLRTLLGKDLGCWCKPLPCHVDLVLDMLVELMVEPLAKEESA